jgi:UDP-glucose 4-epimerase
MKIFLTGGTGFIGSYVVNELVNNGHLVTILARNVDKLPDFKKNPSIELVHGTLKDREIIKEALKGKDACIHLALGAVTSAVEAVEEDTLPMAYILETAALLKVKHIITTSTIATYGNIDRPYAENECTRPIAFYGASKACAESYMFAIAQVYGVRANAVSPGFTFGNPLCEGATIYHDPRFPTIVKCAKHNEPINIVKSTGTQFIWAGDLAKLYAAVLTSNHNRRVFIGMGIEFVTWEEIARMAVEISGSKSEIILEEKDLSNLTPSISKNYPIDLSSIDREFGFRFPSRQKIREHLRYLLDHQD